MFEFYGVEMKNLNFENNNIEANGRYNFGYTLNNINIKNNTIPTIQTITKIIIAIFFLLHKNFPEQ